MPTLRCRLIIVGDATVGKTMLAHQFAELNLLKTYQMTTGVEYNVKSIKIPDTDFVVEFHMVELGGNPIYKDFIPQLVFLTNLHISLRLIKQILRCMYMMLQIILLLKIYKIGLNSLLNKIRIKLFQVFFHFIY